MQKLTVLVFILFCGFIKPQGNEINSIFSKCWIEKDIYDCIMNNGTPRNCAKYKPVVYIVFKNSDSVFIGTLADGNKCIYFPESKDTLLATSINSKLFFKIILESAEDSIIILRDMYNKETRLKSLGPNYESINGYRNFINKLFIAGTYVSAEDSTVIVTFTEDGQLKGYGEYVRYDVPKFVSDTPIFETIIFRTNDWKNLFFHWEKNGENLRLYNINIKDYDWKILESYTDFIKIK